jgi:hypothetical protein
MRALTQDEAKDTAGGGAGPTDPASIGPDGHSPVPPFRPRPTEP